MQLGFRAMFMKKWSGHEVGDSVEVDEGDGVDGSGVAHSKGRQRERQTNVSSTMHVRVVKLTQAEAEEVEAMRAETKQEEHGDDGAGGVGGQEQDTGRPSGQAQERGTPPANGGPRRQAQPAQPVPQRQRQQKRSQQLMRRPNE